MPVANSMRSVSPARNPNSTNGSWNTESMSYGPRQFGRLAVLAPTTCS